MDCSGIGLGTPTGSGEASDAFEAILEPLVAQPNPPSGELQPDTEPVPTDALLTVLGIPMNPFPVPNLPHPVPPSEGFSGTQRIEPTALWSHSLQPALQDQSEWVNPNPEPVASLPTGTIAPLPQSKPETVFEPPTDDSGGILLPEAMTTVDGSNESFQSVPQESATGVSEPSIPASPARQETPPTPLFSIPEETTVLPGVSRATDQNATVSDSSKEEEPVVPSPEPQLTPNSVGHTFSRPHAQPIGDATSAPVGAPQHYTDAMIEQVANHLERLIAQQERSRIQFRLDPPELGTVEIRIEVQGNSVQAWLMADQEITRHALNQHAQHLREQLAERGLNLTQFEVGYGSSQSFAERETQTPLRYALQTQPNLRPPMATESLQRVAYNPNGQWSVWA
ncbi:MAG: flagellar hook-length control protein FliK [Fimbriimonadales bacterium]